MIRSGIDWVLAYGFAPLFWGGFVGVAVGLVGYYQAPVGWLMPVALVAIIVSFAAERRLPYDESWNRSRGDSVRDGIHALVNEASNVVGVVAWAALGFAVAPLIGESIWPTQWPFWLQVLVAIVLADLGVTLAHFASHRVSWLWRLHAVHHSVQRMYGFNGLMKHPLHQAIEGCAGLLPLLLLGMPQRVAAVLAFAIVIQLLLQHSNVAMKLGPLRYVFAFAPVHRFHHLRYGRAGDVNFGLFFCVWDYGLRTAFYADSYRVGSRDLGIGSRPDYPSEYLAQLTEPFRPSKKETLPEALPDTLRRR